MSEDRPGTPTLAEVITAGIFARLCEVHTAIPGRVETYDKATQTADVKPMIRNTIRGEGTSALISEEFPVLPSLNVLFMRSGGFSITFPIKPGDFGLILFSERSIDKFRATGEDVAPGDARCHSMGNGMFLPVGIVPTSEALANASDLDMIINVEPGAIAHVARDGVPESFVPRDDLLQIELAKISVAIVALGGAYGPVLPTASATLKVE